MRGVANRRRAIVKLVRAVMTHRPRRSGVERLVVKAANASSNRIMKSHIIAILARGRNKVARRAQHSLGKRRRFSKCIVEALKYKTNGHLTGVIQA